MSSTTQVASNVLPHAHKCSLTLFAIQAIQTLYGSTINSLDIYIYLDRKHFFICSSPSPTPPPRRFVTLRRGRRHFFVIKTKIHIFLY